MAHFLSSFQDPDNATVQLQGPFLVDRLKVPPAHRNVVMIAAGTGVNPSTCNKQSCDVERMTYVGVFFLCCCCLAFADLVLLVLQYTVLFFPIFFFTHVFLVFGVPTLP